jgi:hypothetical protein
MSRPYRTTQGAGRVTCTRENQPGNFRFRALVEGDFQGRADVGECVTKSAPGGSFARAKAAHIDQHVVFEASGVIESGDRFGKLGFGFGGKSFEISAAGLHGRAKLVERGLVFGFGSFAKKLASFDELLCCGLMGLSGRLDDAGRLFGSVGVVV